jgi:hypothetical protein
MEFDVTTLEEFTRAADVTLYPIETGALLSDHYQVQPRAIVLTGMVSNSPLPPPAQLEGKQNAAAAPGGEFASKQLDIPRMQKITGPVGVPRPIVLGLPSRRLIRGNVERARGGAPSSATVFQFFDDVHRMTDVFQVIDGLMQGRVPVNVLMYDSLEFTNMMITNHRAPRNAGSGGSLSFTINLIQISSADSQETVTSGEVRADVKHRRIKDGGKKDGEAVESGTTDGARVRDSVMYNDIDASKLQPSMLP